MALYKGKEIKFILEKNTPLEDKKPKGVRPPKIKEYRVLDNGVLIQSCVSLKEAKSLIDSL